MTNSFTQSLCPAFITHVKGRTSNGLNLGLATKSQETERFPGEGKKKSQHAKAFTTLADS